MNLKVIKLKLSLLTQKMINVSFELIEYDFKIRFTGCDKNTIKSFFG